MREEVVSRFTRTAYNSLTHENVASAAAGSLGLADLSVDNVEGGGAVLCIDTLGLCWVQELVGQALELA